MTCANVADQMRSIVPALRDDFTIEPLFVRTQLGAPLQWTGALPDPHAETFAASLASRRFRTIENAASEEVSAGWVTPGDPTGDSFALEDMDGGPGTWLRIRIDSKVLPKKWVAMHIAAAEKSKGKKLSARERRELKDDLAETLLPRVLPTTNLVDALLLPNRRLVLLFSTTKAAREAFGKLFFEALGVPLSAVGPLELGNRHVDTAERHAQLAKLEPTRWPVARGGAA